VSPTPPSILAEPAIQHGRELPARHSIGTAQR
jgi:hypothetical protein